MNGRVLIGTAGWTDPSLIASGRFYPPEATTAAARLAHYAASFPLVEVDSSYYGMPAERTAALWTERTPADFTFDIKAFSLFTHHPTRPAALPRDLREALPPATREKANVYYDALPPAVRTALWERFESALLPLDSAGKLGVVLCQFPPWFLPGRRSLAHLEEIRAALPQYTPAVEFRHPRWLDDAHRAETLAFLREHAMPYVCVDEPQGTPSSVPPVVAATARLALVRLHGRNAAAWGQRGAPVAAKYDWLYTPAELAEWTAPVRRLAAESESVHVIFNNCREDKAVVNARQLATLLAEHG